MGEGGGGGSEWVAQESVEGGGGGWVGGWAGTVNFENALNGELSGSGVLGVSLSGRGAFGCLGL